jgi:hypothetical protein
MLPALFQHWDVSGTFYLKNHNIQKNKHNHLCYIKSFHTFFWFLITILERIATSVTFQYTAWILRFNLVVQWKPLNVISLGQRETDNINRMILISKCCRYLH